MKKVILTSALAVLVVVGFSSCSKCQVCTKNASPEIRVCEKDYTSNTQYGLVLDGYQASGYTCN